MHQLNFVSFHYNFGKIVNIVKIFSVFFTSIDKQ